MFNQVFQVTAFYFVAKTISLLGVFFKCAVQNGAMNHMHIRMKLNFP